MSDSNITTLVGTIVLEVPEFGNDRLPTDTFERYQRSEQARSRVYGRKAVMALPGCLPKRLRTTNCAERLSIEEA